MAAEIGAPVLRQVDERRHHLRPGFAGDEILLGPGGALGHASYAADQREGVARAERRTVALVLVVRLRTFPIRRPPGEGVLVTGEDVGGADEVIVRIVHVDELAQVPAGEERTE